MQFETILPPDGLNDWNDALRVRYAGAVAPDRVRPPLPFSPLPDRTFQFQTGETKPGKQRGEIRATNMK